MTNLPRPPAHIQRYVDILGTDEAIRFLLTFGGAELYIPASQFRTSRITHEFGEATTRALAEQAHRLTRRVPLAKPWIAAVWRAQGRSVAEIATGLHVTDKTVRQWLQAPFEGEDRDERQGRLF